MPANLDLVRPGANLAKVTILLVGLTPVLLAQPAPSSAGQIEANLLKLNTLGSVLHIAAHPDDENTVLLAYFARQRNLRTGYLSLTRGEGGQNLIGSEQGDYMGLIRTQELLTARRIDGAEQFFSRAIDFGFSKTADETLAKWGREAVLSDIVWTIRNFRPDVIFLRFSGTPRDGHGQHQSSAILAKEAFAAAADPKRFPEQLQYVKPFQSRRLYLNLPNFTREMTAENAKIPGVIHLDGGEFNPLLGMSYGEIAGKSRSQHASQGMGSPQTRGSMRNDLQLLSGDAGKDPFEGIDTSWKRLPGGAAVDEALRAAIAEFEPTEPAAVLPRLIAARKAMVKIDDAEAKRKLAGLDELMVQCAGLWVDANAARSSATAGSKIAVSLNVVRRLKSPVEYLGAEISGAAKASVAAGTLGFNTPLTKSVDIELPANTPLSQPYWLEQPKQGTLYSVADSRRIGSAENDPVLTARFRFAMDGVEFTAVRPVQNRYVSSVRGELVRPFVIVPAVALEFSSASLVFPNQSARWVHVSVKANEAGSKGTVRLEAPGGWKTDPANQAYSLQKIGEQATLSFHITPPAGDSSVTVRAVAEQNGRTYTHGMKVIDYPHIPPQTSFPDATAQLVHADIQLSVKRIGYVMGAGDEVPESLRQLGLEVSLLSDDDLASRELSAFDVIVTGVRAFNTRPGLRANYQRLMDYMHNGGNVVVQYNVVEGFMGRGQSDVLSRIGPYPITVDRARVTVEEAPIQLTDNAVMQRPNKITKQDFEGWVQERGLYFAKDYDAHYTSLFSSHDPNEDWLPGGMLYTPYGKGGYVFTAYAWFRQLPAGVPGAYRIFANLLSAGKGR